VNSLAYKKAMATVFVIATTFIKKVAIYSSYAHRPSI